PLPVDRVPRRVDTKSIERVCVATALTNRRRKFRRLVRDQVGEHLLQVNVRVAVSEVFINVKAVEDDRFFQVCEIERERRIVTHEQLCFHHEVHDVNVGSVNKLDATAQVL